MICKNCNCELLPQDDVESPRYKLLGCLRCQTTLAAEHRYGDDTILTPDMVDSGRVHVGETKMAITESEALLVLTRISDQGACAEIAELQLAKRLIQHFHICDFGWLLTELDDRDRGNK